VPAFNPGFLGMYTDAESLKLLAKEYKVVYQKTAVKAADDYLIGPQRLEPISMIRKVI